MEYWSYRVHKENDRVYGRLEAINRNDLDAGLAENHVQVAVEWSGINFKDALGPTGRGRIQRRFPLTVGIDVAGTVVASKHPRFREGDVVFANGCDLGEKIDGGFTTLANFPAEVLMHRPPALTAREAMILGTAGFTAALCRHRLEQNGQTPARGKILVSGASGGVGSFSVALMHHAGYSVAAMSGKASCKAWLEELGACEIISPDSLRDPSGPLDTILFGGAIDTIGGDYLARMLPRIELWGNIASVGLASGAAFSTTVMPFILRGVSVLGISSNNCPKPLREELWLRLASDWRMTHLDRFVHRTVTLRDLEPAFEEILNRQVRGRILVECRV